jgi:hypothetical protein
MGNIKTIDNYKNYLLSSVADLFTTMGKGGKADIDEVVDELSEIIVLSYLLSKRLGQDYSFIDERIIKKLKLGILEGNGTDKEYHDYSKLIEYIRGR